jgi:hypothetical protein
MIEEVSRTAENMGGRSKTTRTERTSEAGDFTHQGIFKFASIQAAKLDSTSGNIRIAITPSPAAAVRGPRRIGRPASSMNFETSLFFIPWAPRGAFRGAPGVRAGCSSAEASELAYVA